MVLLLTTVVVLGVVMFLLGAKYGRALEVEVQKEAAILKATAERELKTFSTGVKAEVKKIESKL